MMNKLVKAVVLVGLFAGLAMILGATIALWKYILFA